jgi:predicted dehydrogenase
VIKIKVGVIGAGRWGKKHIDEYTQMKNIELLWVSDLSEKNLKTVKKDYKVPKTSTNYKDVLNSDVEAVSICTSNETHYKVCKDAIEAGKHVLVEKPLTMKSKNAYELVELAKKHKRLLAVGHIFRYNNAINHVKKLLENKFFGGLYYLRLQWTIQWMPQIYPDKQLDIIVDMMPHMYDIMNYLTGLWPKKITCTGKAFMKKNLEDTAYIICEFPKNIITHTEISWTLPEKVRQIDVIGSKATAKIQAIPQIVTTFEQSNKGKKLDVKPNNTLKDELQSFIQAVEKGTRVSNDGITGAKTVELVEKTRESLKKDKTIIF